MSSEIRPIQKRTSHCGPRVRQESMVLIFAIFQLGGALARQGRLSPSPATHPGRLQQLGLYGGAPPVPTSGISGTLREAYPVSDAAAVGDSRGRREVVVIGHAHGLSPWPNTLVLLDVMRNTDLPGRSSGRMEKMEQLRTVEREPWFVLCDTGRRLSWPRWPGWQARREKRGRRPHCCSSLALSPTILPARLVRQPPEPDYPRPSRPSANPYTSVQAHGTCSTPPIGGGPARS